MKDRVATTGIDLIRAQVGQMNGGTVRLTALGLALRARVTGAAMPPMVAVAVNALLKEMGLQSAVAEAEADALVPVLALIRAEMLMGGALLRAGVGLRGWQDREPDVMQAFGEVSLGFWRNVERLAPLALSQRLAAPGARFLDIGAGVGWLSIGMLRRWPALTAVGIEPLPGALAIARDNLAATGLSARMDLREGRGEVLHDVAGYDLAFVPSAFIPLEALTRTLRAVRRALRPGGWVMLAVLAPDRDTAAETAFRAAVWGGEVLGLEPGVALVRAAGFSQVAGMPPAGGMIGFVLAEG
jgi:precorrin-6B methylase 2